MNFSTSVVSCIVNSTEKYILTHNFFWFWTISFNAGLFSVLSIPSLCIISTGGLWKLKPSKYYVPDSKIVVLKKIASNKQWEMPTISILIFPKVMPLAIFGSAWSWLKITIFTQSISSSRIHKTRPFFGSAPWHAWSDKHSDSTPLHKWFLYSCSQRKGLVFLILAVS